MKYDYYFLWYVVYTIHNFIVIQYENRITYTLLKNILLYRVSQNE